MTTDIRLLFRRGPATTIRFNGTFDDFLRRCVEASKAAGGSDNILMSDSPKDAKAIINLKELACATVSAVRDDTPPTPVNTPDKE